jgi:hypothetical protein
MALGNRHKCRLLGPIQLMVKEMANMLQVQAFGLGRAGVSLMSTVMSTVRKAEGFDEEDDGPLFTSLYSNEYSVFTAYSLPIHCLFTAYSLPMWQTQQIKNSRNPSQIQGEHPILSAM